MWAGPGFHLVHYPLHGSKLFNIVAVFRTPNWACQNIVSYEAELKEGFQAAHSVIKPLLGLMNVERRWRLSDRDPVRDWSRGRVTLLGDAAHPMLQSAAQGACMAIEDGVYLAELMHANGSDYESAFQQYQTGRCARTARVQLAARRLWRLYHAEGTKRDARRRWFIGRSEQDIFKRLAWLYDGIALQTEPLQPSIDSRSYLEALGIGL
jgi:salicylate hydroxylase